MPREVLRQSNFNGGELSPSAIGRRDLKAYASSLALARNLMVRAEGPIRRRPGLAHVDMVRNRLEPVTLDAGMVAMPNGGTPADLVSGAGTATTADLGAGDYVIATIDFGAPTAVGLIDLTDFALTGGGGTGSPAPPQRPWDFLEAMS